VSLLEAARDWDSISWYHGLSCSTDVFVDGASASGLVESKAAIRFCREEEVHRGRVCRKSALRARSSGRQ